MATAFHICLCHEKICPKIYVSCLYVDQPVNVQSGEIDLLFEKIAHAH